MLKNLIKEIACSYVSWFTCLGTNQGVSYELDNEATGLGSHWGVPGGNL